MSVYITFENIPFYTLISSVGTSLLGCGKEGVIEKA